jgi:TonB family protein
MKLNKNYTIMKTKKLIKSSVYLNLIFIIPVIVFLLSVVTGCSASKKIKATKTEVAPLPPPPPPPPPTPHTGMEEEIPYVVVEEMPLFPGGDSTLLAYIMNNTRYPESAKASGIQGRVIVRFCVTKTGGIDLISVLKGVSAEIDSEAVRVVSTLPAFKPGRQGGKPVPVWYMVPITFSLTGSLPPSPPPPPPPSSASDTVYTQVDEMPEFQGGDAGLLKFIAEQTSYPAEAKTNKIQGKVLVKFVVRKDGSVSNVSILKGVDPELDAEAIKVIKSLPPFDKPGIKSGQAVAVNYVIPITFSLK